VLEVDLLIAELDGLQASIDEDLYAGRHSCGEAEVVGGGHAVHHGGGLIATRYSADDSPIIGNGCAARQAAFAGPIVKTAVDTPKLTGGDEALQRLIHGSAAAEIHEVAGRPNLLGV